jgi:predicted peptidase
MVGEVKIYYPNIVIWSMKKFLLLAIFVSSASLLAAQDLSLYEKQLFISNDDTLRCRILTPVNYKPGVKYPLVVVLHGSGERGDNNESQLIWGGDLFVDSANRAKYPAIVVFPQCPANERWAPGKRIDAKDSLGGLRVYSDSAIMKPMKLVLDFIDTLIAAGRVDTKKIYVGGLSMGGMGTFDILSRRPDLFTAAFVICGAGDPNAIKKFRKGLPVWVFHGAADPVVLVSNGRLMVDLLQKNHFKVKYTEYPGVGHDSWKNAFAEKELLPWLFAQKK